MNAKNQVWSGAESIKQLLQPVTVLKPDPLNVRLHGDRSINAITQSLRQFGQIKPIVFDENGVVLSGNGTLTAAKGLGWTHLAAVQVQHLSEQEKRAYAIADNRTAELSTWDFKALETQLADLGDFHLDINAVELESLKAIEEIKNTEEKTKGERYTSKIGSVFYEPQTSVCPAVDSLCDRTKVASLLAEIEATDGISDEVKSFLKFATERHSAFSYSRIAEFYSHQPAHVQALMERSALVLIDYEKALEYGFIKLDKRIAEIIEVEQ